MTRRCTHKRAGIWLLLIGLAAACGGEDSVTPDPTVAPFVGTWEAAVFTITSDADPTKVFDVVSTGWTFTIVVEPSGQYTATLAIPGQPRAEVGQLTVVGSTIRLDPTQPPGDPATSSYAFTGEDRLTLDGPTVLDFNDDGEDDPAQAHIVLDRR